MRRALSCLVVVLCAPPVFAGQPISESLVDCGALYAMASGHVGHDIPRDKLLSAAGIFAEAAERQADREGVQDPRTFVDVAWGEACETWSAKGASYFLSQDFRDWTSYCRALARDRGLSMPRR